MYSIKWVTFDLQCRKKTHKIRWIKITNEIRMQNWISIIPSFEWYLLNSFLRNISWTSILQRVCSRLHKTLLEYRFFLPVLLLFLLLSLYCLNTDLANCKMWQIWLNIRCLYMEWKKVACYSCDTSCNSIPFSHFYFLFHLFFVICDCFFDHTVFLPSSSP